MSTVVELLQLIEHDIPEGRRHLQDSHANLEKVAAYCEGNYLQATDKPHALKETKSYTTQSLASVAYQINTLATNFLHLLDLQSNQLKDMESSVSHLSQTVMIHKEKVARREIGVLTTNKTTTRPQGVKNPGIIFPDQPERPIKYVRKPIDYAVLDDIGHGVKQVAQANPRSRRPSSGSSKSAVSSAGQAPTTKPPTPPSVMRGGTLTRQTSSPYRTPAPPVSPPSVPSHYAPGHYQKSQQEAREAERRSGYAAIGNIQMVPGMPAGGVQNGYSPGSNRPTAHPPPPPSHQQQHMSQQHQMQQQQRSPQRSVQQITGHPKSSIYRTGSSSRPVARPPPPPSPSSSVPPFPSNQVAQVPPTLPGGLPSGYGPGMQAQQMPPQQQQQMHSAMQQQQMRQQQQQQQQGPTTPPISAMTPAGAPPSGQMLQTQESYEPPPPPPLPDLYGTRPGNVSPPLPSPPLPPPPPTAAPPLTINTTTGGHYGHHQPLHVAMAAPPGDQELTPPPLPLPVISIQNEAMMDHVDQLSPPLPPPPEHRDQVPISQPPPTTTSANMYDDNYGTYGRPAHINFSHQGPPSQHLPNQRRGPPYGHSYGEDGSHIDDGQPDWVPKNYLDKGRNDWVPKNYIRKVCAIYDYTKDKEDELSFTEGAVIYVIKRNDDGWWEGVMDGVTGLFPGNYVEPI